MKNLFPKRKSTKNIFSKVVCLILTLTFLFNITTPVFAFYNTSQEEELLLKELSQSLEEEYSKTSNPTETALELCLKNNNYAKCSEYVDLMEGVFSEAIEETEKNKKEKKNTKENLPSPLSKKQYFKELSENTKQEYKNKASEIEETFKRENSLIEQQYKNVTLNSPQYSQYAFAKSNLNNWKKENLQELSDWQNSILQNAEHYYNEYLEEFEARSKEYQADREAVFNAYLRELANNLVTIYDKKATYSKLKMTNLFVILLSTETDQVKFFTKEQRSKVFRFLKNTVSPSASNNSNPCRFHTRQRKESELKEYYAYQNHLKRMEDQTQGTLSARDQIAKQSRPFEQSVLNDLRQPVFELADEESCQAAFSALNGLAFYKGWDMSSVTTFMLQNATQPLAAQALLIGTKTLIDTKRVELLYTLHLDLIREEHKYSKDDDLKLKEKMFFDNRFYRTPYNYSRYSKEDGGGDAWQDVAKMLSNEKTTVSKQIQHQILDYSVNFSNGKITFNHNIPFIYGLLMNNPKVIDTFVPSASMAYNGDLYYFYNGKGVSLQYFDDHVDAYIKDEQYGSFYLSDNAVLNYDDGSGYATITVGELRKQAFNNFKENKDKKLAEYNRYFEAKKLKPSAVYAQAFYQADFVDLTAEEKLTMDKALEEKYPHLKKLNRRHKEKLEKRRENLELTSGIITIFDWALTIWCVADLYKAIKWGAKGFKALRTLITAGKTSASLSGARKIAFFRSLITENKNVLSVHKKLKKIRSIDSRIVNKFPAYSKGIELTRVSHDGTRMLQVVKLDGTPVRIGQNMKKGEAVETEFSKIMMGTRNYVSTPAGMPGQRLAVQHYNKYVVAEGKGKLFKRAINSAKKAAKTVGPIKIFKKDGTTPVKYSEIKFNSEGYFEVDGDLLKTFKATMEPSDITRYNALVEGTIADLERTLTMNAERFAYLKANTQVLSAEELIEYEKLKELDRLLKELKGKRYITLRAKNKPTNIVEKWRSHKKGYEVVPLYDINGNIVAQVSLDLALKNSSTVLQAIKEGNKLILNNGKIWLGSEALEVSIGAPKEVINIMARVGRPIEDFSFLTLTKKASKMWPLFVNNALTFSAASTGLGYSLNQSPFNNPDDPHYISQPWIFGISVGFPYLFSLVSPMVSPFVKRFGAANVQTTALLIAGSGMGYATLNGYKGFASKKKDIFGKPIYDANGKTLPADEAPSYKPLVIASLLAGISSSLTRASLNTAINRYQTSHASMAVSMLAKNVGSMLMTIIPWAMESRFLFGKDNIDFSISYPVLTGLSVLGILAMKGFIPSSVARESGYKIMPHKTTLLPKFRDFGDAGREIFKPFSLFTSRKILPYYLSYISFGATESYVFFKTYNTFTRDNVDNLMKNKGTSKNTNKLMTSFIVTLPSAFVRGLVKRKTSFSQGIVNSIIFTTAGTIGLMLPGDDHSDKWNIVVGSLSGVLIACGTANMYQYLQKRMIAGIADPKVAGVLPLARKFDGITGLRTTAISFYSGAYIGSFIPFGYSFFAEKELSKGATDFEANQSVFPLALGVYGLGIVPLLATPVGQTVVNGIKPYSPYLSFPLGTWGMYNLFNNAKPKPVLQRPDHMPIFNNVISKPTLNFELINPTLKVAPYQEFNIKPLDTDNNTEEETTQD